MQFLGELAFCVLAFVLVGEASAVVVQRTFVSKHGLDTNRCSATEPCRTFGAAIAQTQAGGEVIALDSAGYGPVTITQSISLIAPPGVYAGITTTSPVNGITINAGVGDVVVLRGLALTGLGVGVYGIELNSAKVLRVDRVSISGFEDVGIWAYPDASSATVSVTDSLIEDNVNFGIFARAAAGQVVRITLDRSRVLGNGYGIVAQANSRVIVRDSVAAGSSQNGLQVISGADAFIVENSLISENANRGIYSQELVRVAGTTVTENGTGLFTELGGSILSRGNNTVEGNTANGAFTALFAAK